MNRPTHKTLTLLLSAGILCTATLQPASADVEMIPDFYVTRIDTYASGNGDRMQIRHRVDGSATVNIHSTSLQCNLTGETGSIQGSTITIDRSFDPDIQYHRDGTGDTYTITLAGKSAKLRTLKGTRTCQGSYRLIDTVKVDNNAPMPQFAPVWETDWYRDKHGDAYARYYLPDNAKGYKAKDAPYYIHDAKAEYGRHYGIFLIDGEFEQLHNYLEDTPKGDMIAHYLHRGRDITITKEGTLQKRTAKGVVTVQKIDVAVYDKYLKKATHLKLEGIPEK